jgi:hypothetical protein
LFTNTRRWRESFDRLNRRIGGRIEEDIKAGGDLITETAEINYQGTHLFDLVHGWKL